jgi:hypothetical protein
VGNDHFVRGYSPSSAAMLIDRTGRGVDKPVDRSKSHP